MDVHSWMHDLVEVQYPFTFDPLRSHHTDTIWQNSFSSLPKERAFSLDVKYPMLNYDDDDLNKFKRKIVRDSNNWQKG